MSGRAGHYSATDRKREDEHEKQRRHLHPEEPQEVILRGETHELKDSGGYHYQKTDHEPSLGISHDDGHGLPRQAEPEQTQIMVPTGILQFMCFATKYYFLRFF